MGLRVFFVLSSLLGGFALEKVILQADRPFLRVRRFDEATLKCCYKGGTRDLIWFRRNSTTDHIYPLNTSDPNLLVEHKAGDVHCGILTFKNVIKENTGLYQCNLTKSNIATHGTYMQVYEPMQKMINLKENTKNTILMVEGILLLLCVLVPSATLLLKSKSLTQLEMKKAKAEEENIYQGLNLDECCTTYDQIERSQAQGAYQDVGNVMDEREDFQLEKP